VRHLARQRIYRFFDTQSLLQISNVPGHAITAQLSNDKEPAVMILTEKLLDHLGMISTKMLAGINEFHWGSLRFMPARALPPIAAISARLLADNFSARTLPPRFPISLKIFFASGVVKSINPLIPEPHRTVKQEYLLDR
jgi:hypothetical protein